LRLGEQKEKKDQFATIRTIDYDKLGRLIHDRVTTLDPNVDGAVRPISRTYEVRGMLDKITSYDNATVGSGTIVNEVQFAYNDFSQLITEYQAHSGAVNTGTSPKVQYGYANGTNNNYRPTSLTYPSGRVLDFNYGSTDSLDDRLSRLVKIQQSAVDLVSYSYLGYDRTVRAIYGEPGVELTYIKQGAESVGDAGDQYTGLDRFGRVVDQRWLKTSDGTHRERIQYGFDRANNRTFRDNLVAASGQDEFYTYDGLSQLSNLDRGDLNAGRTAITGTPVKEEDFNYDPTGNWRGTSSAYVTKTNGTVDLNQNRTHNKANEVTAISTTVGTAWPAPTQNKVGNLTQVPQPNSLANTYDLKYDAWNRLVEVKVTAGSVVGTYKYDGLNRRIVSTTTNTRDFYYSKDWQILEEKVGGTLERQSVWGLRYADDLVLRDRDTNGDGTLDERRYALHDYSNVTAIVDTSGAAQERYGFDAYGQPRVMTSAFGSSSTSSQTTDAAFGAYRWDKESGLFQVRNRHLHPKLGRWLSRDPIGQKGGINLYAYAKNSPANLIDPTGEFALPIAIPAALLALFEALVLALGLAAALLLIAEIIRAAVRCIPGRSPLPNRPSGDCTPAEYAALKATIDALCPGKGNSLTRCEPSDDCDTLVEKGTMFAGCATARDLVNKKCFRGGNATHREEANNARNAVARCAFLWETNCL
jgi:RHS repeat-associated protein